MPGIETKPEGVRKPPERGSVTRSGFANQKAFRLEWWRLKVRALLRLTEPRSGKIEPSPAGPRPLLPCHWPLLPGRRAVR